MDQDRYEKIWAEIIDEIKRDALPRLPEEKTRKELAHEFGFGTDKTNELLETLVIQGKLLVRVGMHNAKYYKPNPDYKD